MAKILIVKSAYLLELPDECDLSNDEEIDQKANFLTEDFVNDGDLFSWVSARFGHYDTEIDNLGRCANCGAWTTDSESENNIAEVSIGAKINGILYCDICLPKGHPLAF
jgi:hypothetical protein